MRRFRNPRSIRSTDLATRPGPSGRLGSGDFYALPSLASLARPARVVARDWPETGSTPSASAPAVEPVSGQGRAYRRAIDSEESGTKGGRLSRHAGLTRGSASAASRGARVSLALTGLATRKKRAPMARSGRPTGSRPGAWRSRTLFHTTTTVHSQRAPPRTS
jgi:hypothetical protein